MTVFASAMIALPALGQGSELPGVSISVHSQGVTTHIDPAADGNSWANQDGTFGFGGAMLNPGSWSVGWSLLVDPDPFIIANLVVINNTAATQLFTLTVTLPVAASPFGSLMGGSVTGSVTDLNGNGATLSSPMGGSIYTAFLDGASVATLLDFPLSASTGAFESNVIGPASFGNPIPSQPGPGVTETMAIQLSFLLTPGDAASFTSSFIVIYTDIPAPTALPLVAAMVLTRRRRTA